MPPKAKTKSKKDSATYPKAAIPREKPQAPRWPPFSTLLPAADLSLHPLLPDQILTISGFWTPTLCNAYLSFLSTLPLTTTPGNAKKGEAVRVNDRFQVEDAAFAERLWRETALKDLVLRAEIDGNALDEGAGRKLWGGEVLGLNSNIRIYRYRKGQFFDQHYDASNNISFPSSTSPAPIPSRTTWTLLLYLTSPSTGCVGGETVFYPEPPSKREAAPPPVVASLETGMALLHRHGRDCLLHEGREVAEGEKWVIRSDLVVRR